MKKREYRLAAVLFTDIVGFSRMMEEDEQGTLNTLDYHNGLIEAQVSENSGTVIKTIGDSYMVRFDAAIDAVNCAIAIQRQIGTYNENPKGKPLSLRVGIHLGDIHFIDQDAFGDGVNIASRLQGVSQPGRITISREVYSQVSGKISMKVNSLGQLPLKNISREIHGYEINPFQDESDPQPQERDKGQTNTRTFSNQKSGGFEDYVHSKESAAGEKKSEESEKAPTFQDLKNEFKHFKNMIVRKVKEAAESPSPKAESGMEARIEARWETKLENALTRVGKWIGGDKPIDKRTYYQKYHDSVQKNHKELSAALPGHITSYLGVNAILLMINYFTSWSYPWFVWSLVPWGIGLINHIAKYWDYRGRKKELEQLGELDDLEARDLKTYQKSKGNLISHTASFVGVSALFLTIIQMTGAVAGGWYWALLIPPAVMGMGLLGHIGNFFSTMKNLGSKIKALFKGKKAKAPMRQARELTALDHAKDLQKNILDQIKNNKHSRELLGDETVPLLEKYVDQIGTLSNMENEVSRLINEMPILELEKEEVRLELRKEKATSPLLVKEYDKSLSEIGKQRRSYESLKEQQEILGLRVKSSLNALKQIQIDLARVKSIRDGADNVGVKMLKEKSEDLRHYIEDFQDGLDEL